MLHHARQMLQLVHRMYAELGNTPGGVKGQSAFHRRCVGADAVPARGHRVVPDRYPLVNISLEERTGGKAVVLAVADGTADVGIIASQTHCRVGVACRTTATA